MTPSQIYQPLEIKTTYSFVTIKIYFSQLHYNQSLRYTLMIWCPGWGGGREKRNKPLRIILKEILAI